MVLEFFRPSEGSDRAGWYSRTEREEIEGKRRPIECSEIIVQVDKLLNLRRQI